MDKKTIELNNLKNMFIISANCGSNDNFSENTNFRLIKKTQLNHILKSFLYINTNNDLVLVFSDYTTTGIKGYFTGIKMWYYQNMISTVVGNINQFFYDNSLLFYKDIKPYIQNHLKSFPNCNLFITGIGVGGAMSQAFYYHISNYMSYFNVKIIINTFGSPRLGDYRLRDWFFDQPNLSIRNYALLKKFGYYKRVDPVITFPHKTDNYHYVNNANLVMIYNNKICNNSECHIDQDDMTITIPSMIKRLFIPSDVFEYWKDIHTINEYYENIMKI